MLLETSSEELNSIYEKCTPTQRKDIETAVSAIKYPEILELLGYFYMPEKYQEALKKSKKRTPLAILSSYTLPFIPLVCFYGNVYRDFTIEDNKIIIT